MASVSWAERTKATKSVSKTSEEPQSSQSQSLKVEYRNRNRPTQQSTRAVKRQSAVHIPDHVRYEKEPDRHEDIVIHCKEFFRDPDHERESRPQKPLIPNEQCVLNHFSGTEKNVVYQLTLPFLSMDDAIHLFICYRKYCQMYRNADVKERTLLSIWRYLYQREYGSLKWHKKRSRGRPTLSAAEQKLKHELRLQDPLHWKEQYLLQENKKFLVHLSRNQQRLSYYLMQQERRVRLVDKNDVIIVSLARVSPSDILRVDALQQSNWYDVDDENLWTQSNNPNYYYASRWELHRKLVARDGKCGFRNLSVDVMMDNVDVAAPPQGLRAYVTVIRYLPLKCYLVEIVSALTSMHNHGYGSAECREKRQCSLLTAPSNCNSSQIQEDDEKDGALLQGTIVNRILDVEELQSKLRKFTRAHKKLKVLVYAMWLAQSVQYDPPQIVGLADLVRLRQQNAVAFVVVDYFDFNYRGEYQ